MDVGLLLLLPLGFAIAVYGTIVGAGGGFILVPVLLILYPDYEPAEVTAISLAVVWGNASSGSIAYARQHRIDYVTGLLFAAASLPGVIAGALAVHLIAERFFAFLFGLLLLSMSGLLLRQPATYIQPPLAGRGLLIRTVATREGETYRYAYKVWQGVLLSVAVGFVSSLFGIGGGVIHVPVMITLFHFPIQFAVATSQFILAFMSGGGTLVHLINGTLSGKPLVQALVLGAGAIPGAQVGAHLSRRIRGQTIIILLAAALVALAIRLMIRAVSGL